MRPPGKVASAKGVAVLEQDVTYRVVTDAVVLGVDEAVAPEVELMGNQRSDFAC